METTFPPNIHCINEYKHCCLWRLVLREFGCCNNLGAIFLYFIFFNNAQQRKKCFIRNYVNSSSFPEAQRKFKISPLSGIINRTHSRPGQKRLETKLLAHNSPIFHVVFFLGLVHNISGNRKIMLLDYFSSSTLVPSMEMKDAGTKWHLIYIPRSSLRTGTVLNEVEINQQHEKT